MVIKCIFLYIILKLDIGISNIKQQTIIMVINMGIINLQEIKDRLNLDYDVKYRYIKCGREDVCLIFIDSMCDVNYISRNIINPLLNEVHRQDEIQDIIERVVLASSAQEAGSLDEAIDGILNASVLILFTEQSRGFYCSAKGYATRAIDIPVTETVIKGPREGFTENIQDNISSIRRRIKTSELKIENFKLGKETQCSVSLIYVNGRAPKELVDYVRTKINDINKEDFILYENLLEESLKCKHTPFDTTGYSEKPDYVSQKLSEGRVVAMFDGTSFAIFVPFFFLENFQATDDYTMNKFMANTGRILRWSAFAMSTLVPGLYLALVTYHFRLIPSIFLFRMAIYRGGVPVPTVVELLYMIIFFQIIREAGVRLPQPIGPSLSIVGALILGDAAVNSGLASQVTVVVVAITSIASYLIPRLYIAIFMWNMVMVLFASLLGLPGFFMGFVLLVAHMSGLTTCGYPYLYPLGTLGVYNYKDTVFRGDMSRISNKILIKDQKQ